MAAYVLSKECARICSTARHERAAKDYGDGHIDSQSRVGTEQTSMHDRILARWAKKHGFISKTIQFKGVSKRRKRDKLQDGNIHRNLRNPRHGPHCTNLPN